MVYKAHVSINILHTVPVAGDTSASPSQSGVTMAPAYRDPPPYSSIEARVPIEESKLPAQTQQTVPKAVYTPVVNMPVSPQLASQPPSYMAAPGMKQQTLI